MKRLENLTSMPTLASALLWKVRRHLGMGDLRCVQRLCGDKVREDVIRELLLELSPSKEPLAHGHNGFLTHLDLKATGRGRGIFLYICVRLLRPSVVIETGCFTGSDTALLLLALERNENGHLVSIDLRAVEGRFSQFGPGLPEGVPIGFLVPDSLKHRWTLIVGDVRDELLPVLKRFGEVDFFYHDSHHSYDHMMWEFTTAWPHLKPGGLLVSDDIAWNTAFRDFARGVGRRVVIHNRTPNVGALLR